MGIVRTKEFRDQVVIAMIKIRPQIEGHGFSTTESSWKPKIYTLNTGGSEREEMLEDESSIGNILHPIVERPPPEYVGLQAK